MTTINNNSEYIIRPLMNFDIKQVYQLSKKIGWNGTQEEWADDIKFSNECSLVITHYGNICGVGLGLPFKSKARLASIIVDPAYRGQGLGKRLVNCLIEKLESKCYKTIELEASNEGQTIYEKAGFRSYEKIVTLAKTITTDVEQQPKECLYKSSKQKDLNAIINQIEHLDTLAFGASRRYFIEKAVASSSNHVFIHRRKEVVTGFLICSKEEEGIRIGPWIHENGAGAERLLKAAIHLISSTKKKSGKKMIIHVPKSQACAITILGNLAFEAQFESMHMVRGDPPSHTFSDSNKYLALWSLALG